MHLMVRSIGHEEHNSFVVSRGGQSVAVIDTGGDYRVTGWCPRHQTWRGEEFSVHADYNSALEAAKALILKGM